VTLVIRSASNWSRLTISSVGSSLSPAVVGTMVAKNAAVLGTVEQTQAWSVGFRRTAESRSMDWWRFRGVCGQPTPSTWTCPITLATLDARVEVPHSQLTDFRGANHMKRSHGDKTVNTHAKPVVLRIYNVQE
jgi:hypothetical protein